MSEELKDTVTPAEDKTTDEETVIPAEPESEPSAEPKEGDAQPEESSEVDYQQKYETLEKEVKQLRDYIVSQREDAEESGEEAPKVPTDVKDFLTEFAEKPHETIKKVIDGAVTPYKNMIREMQQQQAIDFIHSQKDFSETMYDDLRIIVEGPERNKLFDINGVTVKLKDLPPRQKAEAALQIYRAKKQQVSQPSSRPKPVVTTKSKSTQKSNVKPDELLSAEEFAAKYKIPSGAF